MTNPSNVLTAFNGTVARMPAIERSRAELGQLFHREDNGSVVFRQADKYTRLVPRADLVVIEEELRRGLAPATTTQTITAVAVLLGAYRKADLEDPDIFAASLVDDLSEYPPDILVEMVRKVRRTLKWSPTISECREVCERLIGVRRAQAHAVESMLREHERREEKARQEEERERQKRQRLAERRARLVSVYGADVVPAIEEMGDIERFISEALSFAERQAWYAALERVETWALVALWHAAVIARAVYLGKTENVLTVAEVVDIARMVQTDYGKAWRLVMLAEGDRISRALDEPSDNDPDAHRKACDLSSAAGEWRKVWQIAREMIEAIRARWPVPECKSNWELMHSWLVAQGMDEAARYAFVLKYTEGDPEAVATVKELVEAEKRRFAAVDTKAVTHDAVTGLLARREAAAPAEELQSA